MRLRIIARLVLMIRDPLLKEWVEITRYDLNQPVMRIGRTTGCEIYIKSEKYDNVCRGVSRKHATLYYYNDTYLEDRLDYYIQDGVLSEASFDTPHPESIPSRVGTYVNGIRLEIGEKKLLKNKDEISLIPNNLKLIYLRETKSVSEKLSDDTHIPLEYYDDN